MKLCVTFKTPDACHYEIEDAVRRYEDELREHHGYTDPDEIEGLVDEQRHFLQREVERWFKNGEYATIELDTETHAAKVVKP